MNISPLINRWTVLGALGLAVILTILTLIIIGWTTPRVALDVGFVPANLTMIPAPTHTDNAPPSHTPDPNTTPTLPPGQIVISAYVQIAGTDGDGLRIRSVPGLNGETVFRGEDSEVFIVRDGPQVADGYTWWYLVAPYDETRAGWAAADFLAVVPSP